jgi:hypothetical protein
MIKNKYIVTKETESQIHITEIQPNDPIPQDCTQLDTNMAFEVCANTEEEWNDIYRYPNAPYKIAFPPYNRNGCVCGLIDATGGNIESYLTFYAENRKKQVILTYIPETWESQIPNK